jgi:hypothetical protein
MAKKRRPKRKVKKNSNILKVSENSRLSRFIDIGEKVKNGELKWLYYAVDGKIGYHFYEKR